MKKLPTLKDLQNSTKQSYAVIQRAVGSENRGYAYPEILCASCALYNERRTTGMDFIQEMRDQGGLQDRLTRAFSTTFNITFVEARDLLGFLCEVDRQLKGSIELCEIANTKMLGVHALFMLNDMYFQVHSNGFNLTLHIGHLPFKGSIDELITILSCLFKGAK